MRPQCCMCALSRRRHSAMDPPYLGLLKGNYGVSGMGWFKSYQKAFIDTSRFRPLQHVMGFVLILGYCLEYPHLKRAHGPAAPIDQRRRGTVPCHELALPRPPHRHAHAALSILIPLVSVATSLGVRRRAALAQEKGGPRGPLMTGRTGGRGSGLWTWGDAHVHPEGYFHGAGSGHAWGSGPRPRRL